MLSRAADSIYWLNRYIERAENTARFIDVNLNLLLDTAGEATEQWRPLVITTGDRAVFEERYGEATKESVIQFLTYDTQNPNSILSCLTAARENARTVREWISSEAWEHVNQWFLVTQQAVKDRRPLTEPYRFYASIKEAAHLFAGIYHATMSHSEGWHFGRIGRHLERADKTSRILDVKYFFLLPDVSDVGTPFDNVQWAAVLKSASALEMYRKTWRRIFPIRVADFLIFDQDFPRSIYFCIAMAERSLQAITGRSQGGIGYSSERLLGKLRSELEYAEIEEIMAAGLHEFLDNMQVRINQVGDAVADNFFGVASGPVLSGSEEGQ